MSNSIDARIFLARLTELCSTLGSNSSNPAEINGGWVPAGDDAAGWLYTQQTYDWKGRPLVTTNQDGTQKYASYSACGCAGSEVATLTDEMGRQQKVYNDVLGRTAKAEVLNWNGSVYATTSNTYNARDQVTLVRQYQGADTSGTYQDTTMTYDGYGRLKTKHVPEQNVGTATVYAYNADDTVQSVTDARGAAATYAYNNRHLVTGISYSAPSGIPATPNVSFGYDAAGNRTSMTDGMGSKSYSYNQLSHMISEARTFTGLSGSFTLSYAYNLAGELTGVTDPFSAQVGYNYDSTGRLSGVTGSGFAGISTYASNIQYRAFDTVKSMTYGNSKTLSVGYNNRLAVSTYEVPGILKKSYQRNNDSSLQFTQDQLTTNSKFDRKYTYDHLGRIATALSGAEARGGSATDDRPYNETLSYDAMDHLTTLDRRNWNRADGSGPNSFVNNRVQGWTYDADGRALTASTGYYVYDAVGRVLSFGDDDPYKTEQQFTGEGQRAKTVERRYDDPSSQWVTEKVTYYVTSSVRNGALVSEISEQGAKERTLVYAGGSVLATQTVPGGTTTVQWEHHDLSGGSFRTTDASGQFSGQSAEMDAVGANAGLFRPFTWNVPDKKGLPVPYPEIADMLTHPGGACELDRMPIPCEIMNSLMEAGALKSEYPNYREPSDSNRLSAKNHPSSRPLQKDIINHGLGLFEIWVPPEFRYERYHGWVVFAVPQNSFKGSPLSTEEVNQLGKDVSNLLSNSKCAKFMNALLKQIGADTGKKAFSENAMDIFNAVKNQGGFGRRQGPHGAEGGDTVGNGRAFININYNIDFATANYPLVSAANGRQILHELMHVASGTSSDYSHYEMAKAAWEVATSQGFRGASAPNLQVVIQGEEMFPTLIFSTVFSLEPADHNRKGN